MTEAFLKNYRKNPVIETAVFPGVLQTFDGLRSRGNGLAICTTKPSVTCDPVLTALNLDTQFDAIGCGDQVANKKPHGDHIRATVSACDGDINNTVMIGNSENDVLAAHDAGVPRASPCPSVTPPTASTDSGPK